eukprot:2706610-Rhodomonas_salina.5
MRDKGEVGLEVWCKEAVRDGVRPMSTRPLLVSAAWPRICGASLEVREWRRVRLELEGSTASGNLIALGH